MATLPADCKHSEIGRVLDREIEYSYIKFGGCNLEYVDFQLFSPGAIYFSLDISYSNYATVYPYEIKCEHLVKLNASHNQITAIYFGGIPNINQIDFSYNKVKIIG